MNLRSTYALLSLVSFVILSANIWGIDLYGFDEARNAYCAREMQKANEWIVPSFNGELRALKPPLHYWGMIIGYKFFGYGGLGARLVGVLCGVATVLVTFAWCRKYLSHQIAIWSAILLLSSIHFSIQIHQAVPDPYLIFTVAAGSLALFHGYHSGQTRYRFAAYVLFGLGIMCKGPVALLLPGLGVLMYLIWTKTWDLKSMFAFWPLRGLLIAICIALPWYYLIDQATSSEFTEGFFLTHNLQRFTQPMEGHGGIFLLSWLYVLIGMLPFSWLIFPLMYRLWRERKSSVHGLRFVSAVALMIIMFFSMSSTKLINYTTPAYPFLAIALAWYIEQILQSKQSGLLVYLAVANLIVGLGLSVAAYILAQQDVSLAGLTGHTAVIWIIPVGATLSLFYALRQKDQESQGLQKSLLAIAISYALAGLGFFYILAPAIDQNNPVRTLEPKVNLDGKILSYRLFNPAFVSLWDRNIESFGDPRVLDESISTAAAQDIYVITQERYVQDLDKLDYLQVIGSQKDVFEKQTSVILKVSK